MDTEKTKRESQPKGFRKQEAGPAGGIAHYLGDNAGIEFIGSIVICGVVGALADRAFGTAPWLMLIMILFGFLVGIATAWRALQKPESKE